jgi:hypothetical protein
MPAGSKPLVRFVKDQQIRVLEQRCGYRESLFHAKGIVTELVSTASAQSHAVKHSVNSPMRRPDGLCQQL